MEIKIKPLTKENQKDVIDIFNHYIENSFAACPEHPLPYEAFGKFLKIAEGYPAIVAEDQKGNILGFALLRPHSPISTFSQTAEITYFLKPTETGKGIGKKMLDYLVKEGKKKGLTSILANISALNPGSINFHKKNGFLECGRFKKICRKKDKTFDIVYMQKML